MNICTFAGKIMTDIKMNGGRGPAFFKLAVDRGYRTSEGKPITDYIPLKAWGKNIETLSKLGKGDYIIVTAHAKISKYEKNGETIYNTDLEIDHIESPKLVEYSMPFNNQNQVSFTETMSNTNVNSFNNNVSNDNVGNEEMTQVNNEPSVFGDPIEGYDPFNM